jgi:hypothetical protein
MDENVTIVWEETVIQRVEGVCKSSYGLIDDPDNILSENILSVIINKGWRVASVVDQLELRLEYEDQVRQIRSTLPEHLIFIIRFPFKNVPFDIRQNADILHLSLKLFFPQLDYNILRSLPISWRPIIYNNQPVILTKRSPLNQIETVNFIIQDCLGLDYAPNPTFIDTLSLLADIALHKLEFPSTLKSVLLSQPNDSDLLYLYNYLDVPGKAVQFLQTVWQDYIKYKRNKIVNIADELTNEVANSVIYLDKNHEFQSKVTALIAENILQPANLSEDTLLPNWMHLGLHYYYDITAALRVSLTHLSNTTPGEYSTFKEWVDFGFQWAEWMNNYHQFAQIPPDIHLSFLKFITQLDSDYFSWLKQQYSSLLMQPYLPLPTCVHHVLNHISSIFQPSINNPIALVVIDGMAIQDWLVIQTDIRNANPSWKIDVNGILALIPTLTSVSRQAILSGKIPRYFEKSWLNTNSEEMYWQSFWEEKGINLKTIGYIRGLSGQNYIGISGLEETVEEVLKRPQLSVAVFIVNAIDEIVHTSVMGEKEFTNRLRHWVYEKHYLRNLISSLFERFDAIIITSDHGHIAGSGIGDFSLRSVAEECSLRARLFNNQVYERLAGEICEVSLWQNIGLPQDSVVIIPNGRGLFAKKGYIGISHGGASLEETIVPYITITK